MITDRPDQLQTGTSRKPGVLVIISIVRRLQNGCIIPAYTYFKMLHTVLYQVPIFTQWQIFIL